MSNRTAKANVPGFRQETQFTCMAASLAACLKAHGKDQTEADVNRVMGAGAMRGATWEDLTAAAQYFGFRSTLVVPSTVNQLRAWTDKGIPVVIAYNPEGRPWSHASVVFDVTGEGPDTMVHIMDPNIPDPDETVRIMPKSDFYKVWGEPVGDRMIVRRPACAIDREITPDGRQVMASQTTSVKETFTMDNQDKAARAKRKKKPLSQKDRMKVKDAPKDRNEVVRQMIDRGGAGAGKHKNKGQRGMGRGKGKPGRHPKHKGRRMEHAASATRVATMYLIKTSGEDSNG